MTDFQGRVDKGAAWLDQQRPGWFNKINLKTFNLEFCSECALGQVFGDFESAMNRLFPEAVGHIYDGAPAEWSNAHGFSAYGIVGGWDALRELWITAILNRQFEEQQRRQPAREFARA